MKLPQNGTIDKNVGKMSIATEYASTPPIGKGRSSQKNWGGGGGGELGKILQDVQLGKGAKIQNHKRFCGCKGDKPGWRRGLQPHFDLPLSPPLDPPFVGARDVHNWGALCNAGLQLQTRSDCIQAHYFSLRTLLLHLPHSPWSSKKKSFSF